MAKVSFKQQGIVIEAEPGTRLSDCIRKAKLSIETPCNCMGSCGKCIVKTFGELEKPSQEEKSFLMNRLGFRLACLAKIKGNVEVEFVKTHKALKTINRGYSIEVEVDSEIKKENNGVAYKGHLIHIDKDIKAVLGAAVDIGTTGISLYLVDLETGEILNKISCLNPQTEFGSDVLSRITFVINNEKGTEILKHSVTEKINELLVKLTEDCGFDKKTIYRVIIAANTTMLHLFAGVNPSSIAKAPYEAVFLDRKDFKAKDIGISINNNGFVTLLPSASSYVGADILAGVAATAFHKKVHASIFIDIGTNGEIVAIADGKLAGTSTAAGPALEGMNISCGSRAEEGAIDTFLIDDEFNLSYTTIGNVKPKGICGSGLIDIAAQLVLREIILPSGKFNSTLPEKFRTRLVDKRFYITEDIYISQKDVRQIQLAKGAIAAGVTMLLEELGLSIEKVHEVVIAGAFGYHINEESIKTIGLIPKGFSGEVTFVGNSSVEGARLALLNKKFIKDIEILQYSVKIVELSTKDSFQKHFVEALSF